MVKQILQLLVVVFALNSCSTQQKVLYLQDNTINTEIETITGGEIHFQPNDVISIFVSSKNPELAEVFNLPRIQQAIGSSASSGGSTQSGSLNFTVRRDGTIDYPIIGEIEVAAMTKEELSRHIKQEILDSKLLNDPIVTVEFENLSFSTMGEVGSPGSYNITKDRTTILEALSMSGDLTINGMRDRVFVTRKIDDTVITYQLNLRSKDIYLSPAYYIQQNDVIYVEPNRARSNQSTINGNTIRSTSFWMSLGSFLTTIILLIVN